MNSTCAWGHGFIKESFVGSTLVEHYYSFAEGEDLIYFAWRSQA